MKTSQNGIDLIKHFEGFCQNPYNCPGGYKTIGYGHVIKEGEAFSNIDQVQGEELLVKDLIQAEKAVHRNIKIELKQNQFDALVSFTFNLGGGALQCSTLRQKINRQEHDLVANELKKWIYAGGKKLLGLKLRREAEAELYCL